MLRKKLGMREAHEAEEAQVAHINIEPIAELAAALECIPLAIVQAAAYVLQRAPRYTVAQYLDQFKKTERKRKSLLNYGDGHLRRDWEANTRLL